MKFTSFCLGLACILLLAGLFKDMIKNERMLDKAIDTGILTYQGHKYHVIPWEGEVP